MNTAEQPTSEGAARWPSIPGYRLLCEIASGGMATVYLAVATDPSDAKRLVAVKCCHPHLKKDPAFVAMFLDESRMAALIHHANVVELLELGDATALYFVMQYVDGVSLAEWMTRLASFGERIPVPLLLRVLLDGLAGLGAAHAARDASGRELQLVHRDVSPQNILIDRSGVSMISDFGIAKAEARSTRTRTGQVKGKTGYMSPEQLLLEPIDRRSDLYSAGVVLWEGLVGQRLFDSESDAATINLVLRGGVPLPSTLVASDPALDPIVLRALSFHANERFASAEELARTIEATGVEIAAAEAVGASIERLFGEELLARRVLAHGTSNSEPVASHRSRRRVAILPALAGVGLLTGVGYWFCAETTNSPTISGRLPNQTQSSTRPRNEVNEGVTAATALSSDAGSARSLADGAAEVQPIASMSPERRAPPPDAAAASSVALSRPRGASTSNIPVTQPEGNNLHAGGGTMRNKGSAPAVAAQPPRIQPRSPLPPQETTAPPRERERRPRSAPAEYRPSDL